MLAPAEGLAPMTTPTSRVSARKRLACTPDKIFHPVKPETHCRHRTNAGPCGEAFTPGQELVEAQQCKKGGHVTIAHNMVRDILAEYIRENVDGGVLTEQRLESMRGVTDSDPAAAQTEQEGDGGPDKDVLDVVWGSGGRLLALDIAIVGANLEGGRNRRMQIGMELRQPQRNVTNDVATAAFRSLHLFWSGMADRERRPLQQCERLPQML